MFACSNFFIDTCFTVDAFKYGAIPDCSSYFLTHFHSDHYGGLSRSFVHGPIYCTRATANLCEYKLRVLPEFLRPVEYNTPVIIDGVEVTFFDANHCPGSAIILFKIPTKCGSESEQMDPPHRGLSCWSPYTEVTRLA